MDPITIIVTALVIGASAGLKPTAEQAIKDAYAGLKGLIVSRFGQASASVTSLEANPTSQNKQGSVREDLERTTVTQDEDVLNQAKELLEAVKHHDPETAAAIGFDVEHLTAASVLLEDIIASGTGVKGKDWKIAGDVKVKGVRAGVEKDGGESPNLSRQ